MGYTFNTKMKLYPYPQSRRQESGFALVASLSIMAVLVMISVALYSMSAVATRTAEIAAARVEAQANAKMALMMAIGDLQKYTGADTRITAPAELKVPSAPAVAGAWKSWEGLNHERDSSSPALGRPITPDYAIKDINNASADARFLSWLISGEKEDGDGNPLDLNTLVAEDPTTLAGSIPLLAGGSLQASDTRQIHVVPTASEDGIRYAWWVSPENQKARLQQPYSPRTQDVEGWAAMAKSYSVPDPASFGLDEILDDPESYNPDGSSEALARRALNLASVELLKDDNTVEPHRRFHDFSTSASGLLTNTATGGWRKDLSILTEKWEEISIQYSNANGELALPLFRYSPVAGGTSAAVKPTTSNYDAEQSNLYPWSEYSLFSDTEKSPLTYNTAASSWQSLVNFATKYKEIDFDQGTQTATAPIGWSNTSIDRSGNSIGDGQYFGKYHDFEFNPVLARAQYLIQAKSVLNPAHEDGDDASNHYRMNLRLIPIYTLWNPYNVEIVHSYKNNGASFDPGHEPGKDKDFGISVLRSLPLALRITNKDAPPTNNPPFKIVLPGTNVYLDKGGSGHRDDGLPENNQDGRNYTDYVYHHGSSNWKLDTYLPIEFSLKPGEVKQFSIKFRPKSQGTSGAAVTTRLDVRLKEGFWRADNLGFPLQFEEDISGDNGSAAFNGLIKVPSSRSDNELHATDHLNFEARTDRYTKLFVNKPPSAGFILGVGLAHYYGPSNTLDKVANGGIPEHGARYIKSTMTTGSPMSWAEKYWPSFELNDFPTYTAADLDTDLWNDLISVSFGPRLSFGSSSTNSESQSTKGVLQSSPFAQDSFGTSDLSPVNHPANGAYDITYHVIADMESDVLPTDGIAGYIATGFDDVLGLSRLIMIEVPLRPMASLAELQNWNLRGNNPFPPHQYNLIGNSDATPMIDPDSVLAGDPMETDPALNLQHDDAYCANHLLFDDWFFSSIAPDPTNFGSEIERDIETVYADFLRGDDQLTNRAYQPIAEDRDLEVSDAQKLADDLLNNKSDYSGADGWLKVASRFEVAGMFNVNSTSVAAWRALLGHARNQQVAHHAQDGMVLDTTERDNVVSRHTVAADVKAGEKSEMVGIEDGSEYAGFRTLSNSQLDELSELIVEQVRARGPFLSLSEFINRQLSLNTVDLPLAGDDVNLALAGALQSALNYLKDDPMDILKGLSDATMDPADSRLEGVGYDTTEEGFQKASEGFNTYGFPGWIRQADILRPIAPVLSARDDTFTIRAYGDKLDAQGNVIAQAWCEAIVQRSREFVDPAADADSVEPPSSDINKSFGRRYLIKSFRWLSKDEV